MDLYDLTGGSTLIEQSNRNTSNHSDIPSGGTATIVGSSATEDGDMGVEMELPSPSPDFFVSEEGTPVSQKQTDIFDDAYSDVDVEDDGTIESRWNCPPYKRCLMQEEVDEVMVTKEGYGDRKAQKQIVDKLHELGVQVFVLRHDSDDLFGEINRIVTYISNFGRKEPPYETERCLLFRDGKGRLFNLLMKGESDGLASAWSSLLISFSGLQAMIALTVLSRAFACIGGERRSNISPGFLSLVLGLVLSEEISFVWVNIAMLVRGAPSISAYTLANQIVTDWPRKLIVFILALATAAEYGSNTQHYMTLTGIFLAWLVLAANIGSRAWYNLRMNPVKYEGPFVSLYSLIAAVVTGLSMPYLGYRQTSAGGKAAMETIIISSLLVAVIFVVSDINDVQKYIIVGSEQCGQDTVNMAVGAWWTVTLIICLNIARTMEPYMLPNEEEELLLIKDHASPIGTKVPNLPDFAIDPALAKPGLKNCSLNLEFVFGVVMALLVGAAIVLFSFFDFEGENVPEIFSRAKDLF